MQIMPNRTTTSFHPVTTRWLGALSLAAPLFAGCLDAGAAEPTGDSQLAVEAAALPYRTEIPDGVRITTTGDDCPLSFLASPSPDTEAITFGFSESMLHQ